MDNFVAIDFETANFAQSSVCSVGLPIVCGLLCQRFIPKITQRVTPYLPAFSSLVVALTVGIVVSHNADRLLTAGLQYSAFGITSAALSLRGSMQNTMKSHIQNHYRIEYRPHNL